MMADGVTPGLLRRRERNERNRTFIREQEESRRKISGGGEGAVTGRHHWCRPVTCFVLHLKNFRVK